MKNTKYLLIVASIAAGITLVGKSVHAQQVTTNKISKVTTYNYNEYSTVTVKLNDKNDIVKYIQSTLNLYFGAGLAEDGVYGKFTEDAVKSVQKKLGVNVDGIFGPKTAKALLKYVNKASVDDKNGFSPVSVGIQKQLVSLGDNLNANENLSSNKYSTVTVKLNDKNNIVKYIQSTLNLYFGAGLAEDGVYGKFTEDAVKSVQKKLGVNVDGIFGPKTAKALLKYVNNTSVDDKNGFSPVSVDIQKQLISLGYNLNPNGNLSSYNTILAIRQFQKANNLPVTGKLDMKLLNKLSNSK